MARVKGTCTHYKCLVRHENIREISNMNIREISKLFGWKQCFIWWYALRDKLLVVLMYASVFSLRKHAYSNIEKISPPKTENFQIKILIFFHISVQKIDCGYLLEPPRQGGSNKYQQSMFLSRNKENNVYPCKPQFYYMKVGFKGAKII